MRPLCQVCGEQEATLRSQGRCTCDECEGVAPDEREVELDGKLLAPEEVEIA